MPEEIGDTPEEKIKKAEETEQYYDVKYTGRDNLWDLVMWGMTKIHPSLAKISESGRLAIAKPAEFIGNVLYKIYHLGESLTNAKSGFTGPFATLLGAVVKGMLTGNETESRLDYFRTTIKERKIESKEDVVKYFEDKAREIPEEEIKHKLMELKNNSKTGNTTPVRKNLNGGQIPESDITKNYEERLNIPSQSRTPEQSKEQKTSYAANLLNNNAQHPGRG
jgi:hypothetical protein